MVSYRAVNIKLLGLAVLWGISPGISACCCAILPGLWLPDTRSIYPTAGLGSGARRTVVLKGRGTGEGGWPPGNRQ